MRQRDRERKGFFRRWRVLLFFALAALGAGWTLRVGGRPEIAIEAELPAIGPRTPMRVEVAETGRGLSRIAVDLIQGERVVELARESYLHRSPLAFWGERTVRDEIAFEVGKRTVQGLEPGEATLRVTADRARTWLLSPHPVVVERTFEVRLRPPSISLLSDQHYVTQGGSEVVVYRVGESAIRDGVEAGDRFFPGFPLPAGEAGERFAFYAAPYDLVDGAAIRLTAVDDVGNRATLAFVDRFFPRPTQEGTIRLSEDFMARVVPEILANSPRLEDRGSLLENYIQINSNLRRANRAELRRLAASSTGEFLWSRPFQPMPNAQVMSPFAIRRSYLFEDREVDREFHLGFDLASVRRDRVPAANDGVVVMAGYFGIYGNAIVLDHGFGLMTLYAHLSSFDTETGQKVARGQSVGRTGATGLAGGDHLHFGVLLQGLPVNPVEWWDGHWIRDRIERKLGEAFDFEK